MDDDVPLFPVAIAGIGPLPSLGLIAIRLGEFILLSMRLIMPRAY